MVGGLQLHPWSLVTGHCSLTNGYHQKKYRSGTGLPYIERARIVPHCGYPVPGHYPLEFEYRVSKSSGQAVA